MAGYLSLGENECPIRCTGCPVASVYTWSSAMRAVSRCVPRVDLRDPRQKRRCALAMHGYLMDYGALEFLGRNVLCCGREPVCPSWTKTYVLRSGRDPSRRYLEKRIHCMCVSPLPPNRISGNPWDTGIEAKPKAICRAAWRLWPNIWVRARCGCRSDRKRHDGGVVRERVIFL